MNILFIQPFGNKSSEKKWIIYLETFNNIEYIGDKSLDGDDESLDVMGEIVGKEVERNHYDLVICASRGGQVLFSAIEKSSNWKIPCIVVNGFKDGYEPKQCGPLFLITCGKDFFKTKDIFHTCNSKFKGIHKYPIMLYHDYNSPHNWDEDDHDIIDRIIDSISNLKNDYNKFPESLSNYNNVWFKPFNQSKWINNFDVYPLKCRNIFDNVLKELSF